MFCDYYPFFVYMVHILLIYEYNRGSFIAPPLDSLFPNDIELYYHDSMIKFQQGGVVTWFTSSKYEQIDRSKGYHH